MDKSNFKAMFGEIAKRSGFERAFGGWFRESPECILVLDLQASNYSNLYYLNIKVFLRGAFPDYYGEIKKSRDLVKKHIGDIFVREPKKFEGAFDLENHLTDEVRLSKMNALFSEYLDRFAKMALSRNGIRKLANTGEIDLTPPVQEELDRLDKEA